MSSRLRWRSRRGMLELDIVLSRFLEECLPFMNKEQKAAYESLLEYPDNELWDIMAGRAEAGKSLSEIVTMIRMNEKALTGRS